MAKKRWSFKKKAELPHTKNEGTSLLTEKKEEKPMLSEKKSYSSLKVDDKRKELNPIFKDFVVQCRKRGNFDIYDLSSIESYTFDNYLESWYRPIACIFLQVVAPIYLCYYNIHYMLTNDFSEDSSLGNLCRGTFNSETTGMDIFSKVMCTIVVHYQISKVHKYLVKIRNKPSYQIFLQKKRFAAMEQYEWAYLGCLVDYVCIVFVLFSAIVLTLQAKDPTTVILKAITVLFLIGVDSAILDTLEVNREADKLVDDTTVEFHGNFVKLFHDVSTFFVHFAFWTAPTYVFVCKEGVW